MRSVTLLLRFAAAILLAFSLSSCNFEIPRITVSFDGAFTRASITGRANPFPCSVHDQDLIECEFFPPYSPSLAKADGDEVDAWAHLIGAFAALLGFDWFDPLVLQVPADATAFSGTYRNSQASGALSITEPQGSVRIDATRAYAVEPGKKLVIVDFPPGHALARGDNYFFTLDFSLPGRVERLEIKAAFAGRVDLDGVTYYPPLAPCEADFSRIAPLVAGLDAAQTPISLNPIRNVRGCNRIEYHYPHAPPPGAVAVVEYYNAALDHYFVTWLPDEIATLDAGTATRGWQRTGYTFAAWPSAQPGTSPVCRFYLPPAFGDSHFYGRGVTECGATARDHPGFTLEATEFMHLMLPVNGVCPAGTFAVHRVFSNRRDANHRYTTNSRVSP
jgi:hypothetical protein